MWIIPNNLQLSSGAPDTAGFISDLNEQSQICASSLMVRSKPSRSQTWSQKWKRDSWTALLSGRILRPSHAKPFETEWTCLWPVIPANPSARQESGSEQKTLATSGRTSPDQYELFAPECVFSRTSKDTSPSDSERSLESWEQSVIRRRGEYSLRVKSAHLTNASGSSSWPTASARDHKDCSDPKTWDCKENRNRYDQLWRAVFQQQGHPAPANPSTNGSRQESSAENWATPQAHDAQGPKTPEQIEAMRANGHGVKNLNEQACWGTPTARDHKSGRGNEEREYKELTPMVERTQSGKLNPRWVETLMGLPVGWTMPSCKSPVTIELTNCASSATESCQQPPH